MRKTLYALLCLLCTEIYAAKSTANVENLLREAESLSTQDPSKTSELLDEIQLSYDTLEPNTKVRFHLLKAGILILESKLVGAERELNSVLETSNIQARHRARAQTFLSYISSERGDYSKSFEHLYDALSLLPEVDDVSFKFGTYQRASDLHLQAEAYEEAAEYAKRAIAISKSQQGPFMCFAELALGKASIYTSSNLDARKALKRAISDCDEIGENLVSTNARLYLATLHMEREDYPGTRTILERALSDSRSNGFMPDLAHSLILMAKLEQRTGDTEQARRHALESLRLAERLGNPLRKRDANEVLAGIAKEAGDTESALTYYQAYMDAHRVVQDDIKTRNLAYLITRYKDQDKNNQIKILNQSNQLLTYESEIAEASRYNWQLASLSAVLLLALLGMLLAVSLKQRKTFAELAKRDGLTGIYNRRFAMEAVERALRDRRNPSDDFSLVLFDLDKFKQVNDSYGHAVGDWALQAVVTAVAEQVRKDDIFARIGGEEFAVFLPATSEQKAREMAERCRAAIAAIDSTSSGLEFQLTASFGVAWMKRHTPNIQKLMKRADAAVYQAKDQGGNQVCCHEPPPDHLEAVPEHIKKFIY